MKNQLFNKFWATMIALTTIVCATSCGEEIETIPQLPNMVTIECEAGDRPDFTFTANGNWRLSSDSAWCKFQTSGGDLLDMAGRAGTHRITLVIGEEQIKNQVTIAKITIIMGSHKATIAEIRRAPDHLYLHIFNITDQPIDCIEIGYNGYTPLRIEANFDYIASEIPDWVDVKDGGITGHPGEQTEAYLRIVNDGDRERWPITKEDAIENGYEIVFTNVDGEESFSFPIIFKGMSDEDIVIEGPTSSNFGWEVTPDGKSFSQRVDDELKSFENELKFNIVALKDEYQVVYIERIIERGIPRYETYTNQDEECWMHFDTSTMTLSVDSTETLRYGQVLALPMAIYNLILSDLDKGILFETDNSSGIDLPTLKNRYLEYVMVDFVQHGTIEANTDTQMHIYHSITTYNIAATRYDDAAILERYNVEEAYIAPFANSIPDKKAGIVINPRIEGWTTESYNAGTAGAEVWYNDQQLKVSEGEFYIGENVDELLSLTLFGPKDGFEIGGENIYIVFKVNNEAKKLLVVTPPTK